jgi:hypothetical protein
MHGSVHCEEVSLPTKQDGSACGTARICVVSRRSRRFAVRSARGLDDDGNAAQTVEAEQILDAPSLGVLASHVTVRGSCPVLWEQKASVTRVSPAQQDGAGEKALKQHLDLMQASYGRALLLSCLSKQRPEEALLQGALVGAARTLAGKQEPGKRRQPEQLLSYDMAMCKGRQFGEICADIRGLFVKCNLPPVCSVVLRLACDGLKQAEQGYVWRVNCFDSVDRSLLMQAAMSREALLPVFAALGLAADDGSLTREADAALRTCWLQTSENMYRQHFAAEPVGMLCLEALVPPAPGAGGVVTSGWGGMQTWTSNLTKAVAKSLKDTDISADEYEQFAFFMKNDQKLFERWEMHSELLLREPEMFQEKPIKVFTGTWNVAGKPCNRSNSLSPWIEGAVKEWGPGGTDIFVFGFQEVVDLNVSSVLKDTRKGIFQATNSLMGDFSAIVAGKDVAPSTGSNAPSAGPVQAEKTEKYDEIVKLWHAQIGEALNADGQQYTMVASRQLVGVLLCVYARASLATHMHSVHIDSCKTGLGGMAGNKGAVAVRFCLGLSSVCFVCGHFAAHLKYVKERNADYRTIASSLRFPAAAPSLHPKRAREALTSHGIPPPGDALGHDVVVWTGDLNYRIDGLTSEEIKSMVAQGALQKLTQNDQLRRELEAGRVLMGFTEGALAFAPTYKFDPGTDVYDTSPKARAPAWCDRVLFRGRGVSLVKYDACQEMRASDHKPVVALLEIKAKTLKGKDSEEKEALIEGEISRAQSIVNEKLAQCVHKSSNVHDVSRQREAQQHAPLQQPTETQARPAEAHANASERPAPAAGNMQEAQSSLIDFGSTTPAAAQPSDTALLSDIFGGGAPTAQESAQQQQAAGNQASAGDPGD